jgi:hypothetical protein
MSAPPPAERPGSKALLGIARTIIEVGAIWVAFGYLSLRAFCNFGGLPLIPDVRFERYLEETYYLITTLALSVVTDPFFLIALLVCCGAVLASILFRRSRKAPSATPSRWAGAPWALVVWVLVSAFWFAAITAYLGGLPHDVLAGKLSATNLLDTGTRHFYSSIALALFACSGCWLPGLRQPQADGVPITWSRRALYAVLCLFAGLSVANIPIVFGASLRNKEVFIVRLHLDGQTDSPCVARMLESPTQLLFWRAEDRTGYVESVAVSRIKSIDYMHAANVLDIAANALRSAQPEPACETNSDGRTKR